MNEFSRKLIKEIQENYNILAKHFSYTRGYLWPDLKILGEEVFPMAKVLDLGCGNGRLLELFKDKKVDYLGLDFSESLIREAKKRYPGAKFKIGDITSKKTWQNLEDKFDFIFCIAVLHHLPTKRLKKEVVRQIWQALKPEGKALVSAWNLWQKKYFPYHFRPDSMKLKWQLKNMKVVYIPYTLPQGRGEVKTVYRFFHSFTLNELKALFQANHFVVEKSWSSGRNLCLVGKKKI